MEGDPRNPIKSLLKKYDIPIDHLSYEYVENCTDKRELERIVRILRSGEEGFYPDLLRVTEDRLRLFAPDSRVLRLETPVLTKDCLGSDEWNEVEKELLAWEEEMMIIDKSLEFEKGRLELVGCKNMPGVRKVEKQEPKLKVPNTNDLSNNKNNNRIKSGDYASWEKFDVDKELLKLDIEEERKEEENKKKKLEMKKIAKEEKKVEIDLDKDKFSSVEKQVLANHAKERGNECFKSREYLSALDYYNISIELYFTINAFNNRAMTYLKLGKYDQAVKDCNVVLEKEKTNTKALYRRATAYQNMAKNNSNYDLLALQDLNAVVLLEPNNKVAQLELQKLKLKLGIQTAGKKFRMPICEGNNDQEKKSSGYNKEKKAFGSSQDIHSKVDHLPLTYYGPSTSSFECQPHSITHRALSGSLLASEIMCKCNSSRPMQNPLCQKCGEEKSVPKANNATFVTKTINETQNVSEKGVKNFDSNEIERNKSFKSTSSDVIETNSLEEIKSIGDEVSVPTSASNKESCAVVHKNNNVDSEALEIKNFDVNLSVSNSKPENEVSEIKNGNPSNTKSSDIEKRSVKANEIESFKLADSQIAKNSSEMKNNSDGEKSKEKSSSENANNVEVKGNKDSSPSKTKNVSSSKEKSKSKKKKSKNHRKKSLGIQEELEKLPPLRVVHADKYLHPTSVEPKIKKETKKQDESEVNLKNINNFKAFVPNRQCLSIRTVETNLSGNYSNLSSRKSPSTIGRPVQPVSSTIETVTSLEGNKENVLENVDSNVGGKEEKFIRSKVAQEEKPEVEDDFSPYKFVIRWDMLQKNDEAYIKRAQMIRSIGPSKLGEAIGVKLDCEMLITLLECLEKQFVETEPNVVVDILKQLPQMPRFGLIKMFLADKDKNVLKNLIEVVESKGFALEEIKKNLLLTS